MILPLVCALFAAFVNVQEESDGSQSETPAIEEFAPVVQTSAWKAVTSLEQLNEDLDRLAAEYPGWLEVRQLQPDRNAAAIPLIVLGERELGDPSKRPGLLLLPDLGTAEARTTSTLVAVVRWMLSELEGERRMGQLLRRTTIYVFPAPIPGVFEAGKPSRRVDLERNFPSGWRPDRTGTTGPYPLSEPECRALADFLYWRANLAACLEVSCESPFLSGEPSVLSAPEVVRSRSLSEALSQLGAQEPVVFGLDSLPAGPGSLRRYADRALGIWTFLEAPSNAAVADQFRSSEVLLEESTRVATHTLIERVIALAQALPRIELAPVEVEQLGGGMWRLDVPVKNVGQLVTGARHRAEPSARVRLELDGADFVATMVRGASREAFAPVTASGKRVDLGQLGGGETRVLRAIVKTRPGEPLEIRVRSARAGSVKTSVPLPDH